jgi:hypothetical protein
MSTAMNFSLWFEPDREKERYYVLPGMGGRAARRKHKKILRWAIVAGLFVSATLAGLLIFLNQLSNK